MDDSIGNILYIVLLIIFAISSAIRQNSKKKEMERRKREIFNKEAEEIPSNPESPIGSIFEKIEQIITEEEVVEKKVEAEVEEAVSLETESSEAVYNTLKEQYEQHRDFQTELSKLKSQETRDSEYQLKLKQARELMKEMDEKETETEESFSVSELLKEPENLKKAVILSEILNRKY